MTTIEINGKSITFQLKTVAGNLFLEATHINGEREIAGNLVVITGEGRMARCTHVNKDFGFKLNEDSQIKKEKSLKGDL